MVRYVLLTPHAPPPPEHHCTIASEKISEQKGQLRLYRSKLAKETNY
jgi:hypothetical protein